MRYWLPVVALITLVADYATKWIAIEHMKPSPWENIPIIPGFFDFRWRENTGGAFSIFHDKPWIITSFSSIAIIAIAVWGWRLPKKVTSAQIAIGMILGGAVGNLIDRIRFGYVVDFIHLYYVRNGEEHYWPTFNIADMGICFGISIILALSIFTKKLEPAAEAAAPATDEQQPAAGSPENSPQL